MGKQIPIVDYLVLDDGAPHLVGVGGGRLRRALLRSAQRRRQGWRHRVPAQEARERPARCARSRSCTAPFPACPAPYVSALVDLDGGGTVKANLLNIPPDPEHVKLGMPREA